MKKQSIGLALALLSVSLLPAFAADQRARTASGREVILHDDGTWSYADETVTGDRKRDKTATLQYTSKRNTFALYLPPNVWEPSARSNEEAEAQFHHKKGDAFAMVISERIMIPLETLKKAVLENMRSVDKEATIVQEERRQVNGAEVLCLTINAKPEGVPVTYYSYNYTDERGTVQVITFTGQNIFREMKPELDRFLNGFVVLKKEPAAK